MHIITVHVITVTLSDESWS